MFQNGDKEEMAMYGCFGTGVGEDEEKAIMMIYITSDFSVIFSLF